MAYRYLRPSVSRLTLRCQDAILPSTFVRGFHVSTISRQSQSSSDHKYNAHKQENVFTRIANTFRQALPGTTETYVAYNGAKLLYLECTRQADYGVGDILPAPGVKGKTLKRGRYSDLPIVKGDEVASAFWYTTAKRDKTFNAWAQVTILHMWMLTVRIRAWEKEKSKVWQHHFVDHFFYDAEERMMQGFNITSGQARTKYLKELFIQYRGMIAGLDEGFVKDDAVLAAAIWRNIFDASESVDFEVLATIVSYVRRVIAGLDKIDDATLESGNIYFGRPDEELKTVRVGLDKYAVPDSA